MTLSRLISDGSGVVAIIRCMSAVRSGPLLPETGERLAPEAAFGRTSIVGLTGYPAALGITILGFKLMPVLDAIVRTNGNMEEEEGKRRSMSEGSRTNI